MAATVEQATAKNLADLERLYPSIPWREPQPVSLLGLQGKYFLCRICTALISLKGCDVPSLPKTDVEVRTHIQATHQ